MRPRTARTVRLLLFLAAGVLVLAGCGLGSISTAPSDTAAPSNVPGSAPAASPSAGPTMDSPTPAPSESIGPTPTDSTGPSSGPTPSDSAQPSGPVPAPVLTPGTKRIGASDTSGTTRDDAPLAILDRDWVQKARREKNPTRQLRLIVEGACLIAARTAPLKEVLRDAAATDTAARELTREDHQRRYRTQEGLVDLLLENRQLRVGTTHRRAVDTFFALVNSAMYELLITQRGWSLAEWQSWTAEMINQELFGAD